MLANLDADGVWLTLVAFCIVVRVYLCHLKRLDDQRSFSLEDFDLKQPLGRVHVIISFLEVEL